MSIAILSKYALNGEALESLLSNVGNFNVVGHTEDFLVSLSMVKELGAAVILAETAVLTPQAWAYLTGARLVQGFSLVLLGETSKGMEAEEDTPILSCRSSAEELFGLLRSVDVNPKRIRGARGRRRSVFSLSGREMEILELVAKGLSNKQIAEITSLGDQSVKNVVSAIIRKLNCENRTQAALKHASLKR